jgi:hypothetical protein
VNNDTTSLYNSARYFDGTGYVTVPDFAALDLGSIFKLRTTFLPTSIAAIGQGILGRWDGASNKRSYLLIFQAVVGVKFLISTDGTSTAITLEDGDVGVNELKEIEVIADGVNVSLYVNGQLKDSAAFSGTPFASDKTLEVGTYNNGQASLTFLGGIISAAELENAGSTVWAVTGLGTSVTAWEDTIGSNDGTETNGAAYTGQPFNGFVSTWYDQSGNANDATQATTTAQPKIVSAGALVVGGLDFDGVDDNLETTNPNLCNVDELSVFSVLKPHLAPSQAVAFACGSVVPSSGGYGGWRLNFNGYLDRAEFQTQAIGSGSVSTVSNDVSGSDALISYVADFPDASTFANGQAGTTKTDNISPNNTDSFRRRFRIGCHYTFARANFYPEPIKEIILYTSDQSANRVAIETNINDHYNIY